MNISETSVDFGTTGYFSGIINAWLEKQEKLQAFYSYYPSIEGFREAIKNRKYVFNRKLLADIITEQNINAGITPSGKVYQNVELLKKDTTYTVTTGHQLCVFTGPLYFIYKIITTINLAEELKKEFPANDFVPLYWLASEDHDFKEVNHIHLFGKKLSWNPEHTVKGPVGRLSTSSLSAELEELKKIMGESENAKKLYDIFHQAYIRHNTLSEATRWLVNELFSKWGILCLDSDDWRFKDAFKEVMKEEVFKNSSHALISESIEELFEAGFAKPQVKPREINLFYIKQGLRERIEEEGENFRVLNTDIAFTREKLSEEIGKHPEHFSPNVVLRPLFQEIILPNLAYIGGGGELAYWLELKKLFDHYKTDFPVLVLRNSLLWIDAQSTEKLQKFGISENEIFEDISKLLNDFVARNAAIDIDLTEQSEKVKQLYSDVSELAGKVDPTLRSSVEAELQKHLHYFKHLEGKLIKSEKGRNEISVNQIRKLKEKLFPEGSLQERYDNFIPYYLKYGGKWLDLLKEKLKPIDHKFMIISEKETEKTENVRN